MNGDQEKRAYSSETPQNGSTSKKSISWTASEYISHEKSQLWYVLLSFISLAATVFIYLILKDVLAAVSVLVVTFSVGFFANRPPASKSYVLSQDDLMIDDKKYNLEDFKSFSVVEEGAINSIWLKPLGRVSSFLVIYFSPEDEDSIASVLGQFLPHEPRELDRIDKFMKYLRF